MPGAGREWKAAACRAMSGEWSSRYDVRAVPAMFAQRGFYCRRNRLAVTRRDVALDVFFSPHARNDRRDRRLRQNEPQCEFRQLHAIRNCLLETLNAAK